MSSSPGPSAVRPADERQLADILFRAGAERLGVCIVGGGTKLGWGGRPGRFDLLLGTSDLCSTCEMDADDLTATISAGVPVAEAQARARDVGRILPLDGGRPGEATVGGVVATGDQGARGAGYGAVRDLVLGLRATLADGSCVKFGGRTMKNVAGYDMTKLFVGSFGVLGVITEVTFRLLPRPESQALMSLPLRSLAQGQEIATEILASHLQPLVLEAVSPSLVEIMGSPLADACPGAAGGLLLLAGFAGHRAAVERSVSEVHARSEAPDAGVLWDEDATPVLDALTGHTAATGNGAAACVKARATVPVGKAWELVGAAGSRTTESRTTESRTASGGAAVTFRINAARGIVDLWMGASAAIGADREALTAWIADLRRVAAALGGQLTVTDGLTLLLPAFDAWDDPGPAVALMKGIKERFDPNRTLNPGRFVGGI